MKSDLYSDRNIHNFTFCRASRASQLGKNQTHSCILAKTQLSVMCDVRMWPAWHCWYNAPQAKWGKWSSIALCLCVGSSCTLAVKRKPKENDLLLQRTRKWKKSHKIIKRLKICRSAFFLPAKLNSPWIWVKIQENVLKTNSVINTAENACGETDNRKDTHTWNQKELSHWKGWYWRTQQTPCCFADGINQDNEF